MPIKPNPKGAALLLLGPKKGEGEMEEQHAAPDASALESVASDLLAAIEAKDPKAVADALKAAHSILDVPAE